MIKAELNRLEREVDRENTYEALRITGKNILEGGRDATKGAYEVVKFPFMMPTAHRKVNKILNENKDLYKSVFDIPTNLAVATVVSSLALGISLTTNLYLLGEIGILTNVASGFYEYFRYNKDKLQENKIN